MTRFLFRFTTAGWPSGLGRDAGDSSCIGAASKPSGRLGERSPSRNHRRQSRCRVCRPASHGLERSLATATHPTAGPACRAAPRALNSWLNPAAIRPAVAGLQDLFASWQPDVVVLEPYAAAAAFASEAAGLPIIVCGRPALPESGPPILTAASQRVGELCTELSVVGTYWDLQHSQIRSPLLHVDYFSRRWYADLPAVASQTHFAGCQRLAQARAAPSAHRSDHPGHPVPRRSGVLPYRRRSCRARRGSALGRDWPADRRSCGRERYARPSSRNQNQRLGRFRRRDAAADRHYPPRRGGHDARRPSTRSTSNRRTACR